MNIEPRKLITLDGANVLLTLNEVRLLLAEIDCALRTARTYESHSVGGLNSKYSTIILLKRMLEEKCTL